MFNNNILYRKRRETEQDKRSFHVKCLEKTKNNFKNKTPDNALPK